MRLRSGPDDGTVPLARALAVLRAQGVTVLEPVGGGLTRLRRGMTLIVEDLPARLPGPLLRYLAAEFGFDSLRFYFDRLEGDPE